MADINQNGFSVPVDKVGVTRYGGSGKPAELYKMLGMDADSLVERVKKFI